jgi:hypothetical protein
MRNYPVGSRYIPAQARGPVRPAVTPSKARPVALLSPYHCPIRPSNVTRQGVARSTPRSSRRGVWALPNLAATAPNLSGAG